jgi:hypothetical protein
MTSSNSAPVCPKCGALIQEEHRFCGLCGAALPAVAAPRVDVEPDAAPTAPPAQPESRNTRQSHQSELDRLAGTRPFPDDRFRPSPSGPDDDTLAYFIPPNRIIVMSVLTTGLYLFYWMYLTWRHYRDHTDAVAYPLWHALTLVVPVYQLFRMHAHMRVFQDLMQGRGVPSTLNPLLSVGLLLAVIALSLLGGTLVADLTAEPQMGQPPPTMDPGERIGYFVSSLARVVIIGWIMWHAQRNINRYWQHRIGVRLASAPFSLVEIGLVVLGLINWIGWTIILTNPELLTASSLAEPAP